MIQLSTLELAKNLIERKSITPEDEGCQDLISDYLTQLGFKVERLNFGDVKNLWARLGTEGPLFVFAGHTDVVPPGDLKAWTSSPFKPTIRENKLYGRGAADMKGPVAAMLTGCRDFLSSCDSFFGSIGFLITSDEEGDAIEGTKKVVEHLKSKGTRIDYCLVGEPSSKNLLGDTIRVGRRGSLSGELTIIGEQVHIAYPNGYNPIQLALPVLNEWYQTVWDDRKGRLPETVFQVSNINAGTGAHNVIPGTLEIFFNFRYSDATTSEILKEKIESSLKKANLKYKINWKTPSKPFCAEPGLLRENLSNIIKKELGVLVEFSSAGGTSDGRFIVDISKELVEFGVCNESIHRIDEHVLVDDLSKASSVYKSLLASLLSR